MLLKREDILKINDIESEIVKVPEWGGEVKVIGLTGIQRNEYEQSLVIRKGKDVSLNMKHAMSKLVMLSCVDENNEKIFSEGDIEILGTKSGKALSRIYKVAAKLSGLSDEDMDELTKN
jgi:hypothetical protein